MAYFLTPYSITLTPPFDEAKKTSKVIAESYSCNLIENEHDHVNMTVMYVPKLLPINHVIANVRIIL